MNTMREGRAGWRWALPIGFAVGLAVTAVPLPAASVSVPVTAAAADTSPGRVHGRVVTEDGEMPLSGTEIRLEAGNVRRSARTDSDGSFAFDGLPTGEVRLTARHPEHRTRTLSLRVPEDRPLKITVRLQPRSPRAAGRASVPTDSTGAIAGRVLTRSTGEPVAGAGVTMEGQNRFGITDDGGRFMLSDLAPGSHELTVGAVGAHPAVRSVRVVPDSMIHVEVRLEADPVALQDLDVEVESRSFLPGFLQRRENREGHFLVKSDIDSIDPSGVPDLLDSLEGVRREFNPNPGPLGRAWDIGVLNRGPGHGLYCRPTLVLNGRRAPFTRYEDIEVDRVLALEVYLEPSEVPDGIALRTEDRFRPLTGIGVFQGGGPPTRGDGVQPFVTECGAVLVWTEFRTGDDTD